MIEINDGHLKMVPVNVIFEKVLIWLCIRHALDIYS